MELIESKREMNNILFRKYKTSQNDEKLKLKYLKNLIDYNMEFVDYVIKIEFSNMNYLDIYDIGIEGLIIGIENYELDKMCGFEEFMISNIKDKIERNIHNPKSLVKKNA